MRAPPEVVDADHRRADGHGVVHDLADLLGVGLGERAAEHREVLAKDEDEAAVDGAGTRHHAVAGDALSGHAELGAAVLDEGVDLLERAGIEQKLQALARGQLAALVLGGDALGPAAHASRLALGLELVQDVAHARPHDVADRPR